MAKQLRRANLVTGMRRSLRRIAEELRCRSFERVGAALQCNEHFPDAQKLRTGSNLLQSLSEVAGHNACGNLSEREPDIISGRATRYRRAGISRIRLNAVARPRSVRPCQTVKL